MFPLWIETFLLLFVAFLVGLLIAYLIWGRSGSDSRY